MPKQPSGRRIQQTASAKPSTPKGSAKTAKHRTKNHARSKFSPEILGVLLVVFIQIICWELFLLSNSVGKDNGSYNLLDAVIFPFLFGFLFFIGHAVISEKYDIGGVGQTMLCFLWVIISGCISVSFLMRTLVINDTLSIAETFSELLCYAFKYPMYCILITLLPPFMVAISGLAGGRSAFVYEDEEKESVDVKNSKAMSEDTRAFTPRHTILKGPEIEITNGLDFLSDITDPTRFHAVNDKMDTENPTANFNIHEKASEPDASTNDDFPLDNELVNQSKKEEPVVPVPLTIPSDSTEVTSAVKQPSQSSEELSSHPTPSKSPKKKKKKKCMPNPKRMSAAHKRRKAKNRKKRKMIGKRQKQ